MDTSAIQRAVEFSGGQTPLAKAIGASQQMVWQWVNGYRPVPAKYASKIEAATGGRVSCHDIAPSVFPPKPATKRRAA